LARWLRGGDAYRCGDIAFGGVATLLGDMAGVGVLIAPFVALFASMAIEDDGHPRSLLADLRDFGVELYWNLPGLVLLTRGTMILGLGLIGLVVGALVLVVGGILGLLWFGLKQIL
jgi:hypothetical protein